MMRLLHLKNVFEVHAYYKLLMKMWMRLNSSMEGSPTMCFDDLKGDNGNVSSNLVSLKGSKEEI